MAVSYLTSDTLIESIKTRAQIPDNQSTFTTANFLALANEEMDIGLVPTVLSLHEEYYVYSEEITLEASKSRYPIPYRAIGGKLRDLFYKNTSGDLLEMSRINPEDKATFQNSTANTNFGFFYIEGNDIVLIPDVGTSVTGTLLASYYLRPNDLVEESRVAIITSISSSGGTTTFTVDGVPTNMTTSTPVDLLQAKSGHKIRSFDVSPTSVNSTTNTIEFDDNDISSDIEVGDHIAFAGESIIPQCPSDLHSVLAHRVACRVLEALGDREGLAAANQKLAEMELKTATLIDNRVEGAPIKILNANGLLRNSRIRRRNWL